VAGAGDRGLHLGTDNDQRALHTVGRAVRVCKALNGCVQRRFPRESILHKIVMPITKRNHFSTRADRDGVAQEWQSTGASPVQSESPEFPPWSFYMDVLCGFTREGEVLGVRVHKGG